MLANDLRASDMDADGNSAETGARTIKPLDLRGGFVLRNGGRINVFGRSLWVPYFSATFPFGRLRLSNEMMTITTGPISVTVAIPDIERARLLGPSPWWFGASGIEIVHSSKAANPIRFLASDGMETVASALRLAGIEVSGADKKENTNG